MEKDIITESFLLVSEKNLRIEKRSLEQLQKRGASPNVIAEQQKVVGELKVKYEEAKAAKERIQKQNRRFNKYGAIKMMQHAETFVIGIPEKKP